MRLITAYSLIFFTVFSLRAYADSPESIAEEAFKLQMQERYEQMFELYDDRSLKTITDQFKNVLVEAELDDESKVFFEFTLGNNLNVLRDMPPQTLMARLYSWIFSSQLTEEERSLFKKLQFELINVDFIDSSTAQVNYNVVIATDNGDFRRPKKMSLVLIEGLWVIQMEPALMQTLSNVLAEL